MQRESAYQLPLKAQELTGTQAASADNLPETFRRLYYKLYTNSRTSRAERIIEDLSLLLLLKLALEVSGSKKQWRDYRQRNADANEALLPVLRRTYPGLVDRQQKFNLGDDAIWAALEELDQIELSTAPAYLLGEAFQALIGPRLRGEKGQFFTPRALVKAMVQIVAPAADESVLDPACGTGSFLLEAHAFQTGRAKRVPVTGRLVGVDKDHDMFRLASALVHIAAQHRGEVYSFDALTDEQWRAHLDLREEQLFDVVLTNPPFGARIGVRDSAILREFSLGHVWVHKPNEQRWRETPGICSTQDPQTLFLELCVRRLKPGGRLGIVLPEGIFGNRRAGYIWEWLQQNGQVMALLDCPRTTFQPGTDTKTNVLFFRKRRATPISRRRTAAAHTWVGVAIHCGHDRRGRTNRSDGQAHPDDFALLGPAFARRRAAESGWTHVRLSRPDYFVPRYYVRLARPSKEEAVLTTGARHVSLAKLVDAGTLSIRKGHEVGSDAYGAGDVPFVRTSDISNLEIRSDPTVAVAQDVYERFAHQQRLKPGDILMVADGRYRIGNSAILTENNCRCVVQSHLRIFSVSDQGELGPYELLFALNLPSVRYQIRNLTFVQSTLGTLGRRLLELELPVLHGDGPWRARVSRFEAALRQRDGGLVELREMMEPEYEL